MASTPEATQVRNLPPVPAAGHRGADATASTCPISAACVLIATVLLSLILLVKREKPLVPRSVPLEPVQPLVEPDGVAHLVRQKLQPPAAHLQSEAVRSQPSVVMRRVLIDLLESDTHEGVYAGNELMSVDIALDLETVYQE